jgi:hypothetical protein
MSVFAPTQTTTGPAVQIEDGAVAGAGDLIVCTRNHHTVEAGEPEPG